MKLSKSNLQKMKNIVKVQLLEEKKQVSTKSPFLVLKKRADNSFQSIVNGTATPQQVELEIVPGNSYTLEIDDQDKFTVTNNQKI